MLLTLTANSLRSALTARTGSRSRIDLLDLPAYTRQTLGLHGLNLPTALLAGADMDRLEALRDRADKAGCACLLLIEPTPQPFGSPTESRAEAAAARTGRVIRAAPLLGCNAVVIRIEARDSDDVFDLTAERLRKVARVAERAEMNLLIQPWPDTNKDQNGGGQGGLTRDPDRITALIKKIGGFRIGTYPDFETAASAEDPTQYLRRLTPFASAVSASTIRFVTDSGAEDDDQPNAPVQHEPYELEPLIQAIRSVGFDGTLAVDYRGTGDPTMGVIRSREALERALNPESES
jgi:sugar phosphate isomerase/epimerase